MKHHGIVVRTGVALLLAVILPGCHRTRVATLHTVGLVTGVEISTPPGVTLFPRRGTEVDGDIGCVATRLTATLESARGDTLMLTDVRVLRERGNASRCTASAVALVATGRSDITIAVREPAPGRTAALGFFSGVVAVFGFFTVIIISAYAC